MHRSNRGVVEMKVEFMHDHARLVQKLRSYLKSRYLARHGSLTSSSSDHSRVLFPLQVAYQMTSVGADGNRKPFEKPLTTTFLMFMAMAMG